jgi:hypothetical protein
MKNTNPDIRERIKAANKRLEDLYKDSPYKSKDQNFGFAEIGNNQAIIQLTVASQQKPHPKEDTQKP